MDPRHDIKGQIRQLKRELPRAPWLAPRLADLLLHLGRDTEALEILRKSVQVHADYASGWQLLASAQQFAGKSPEALRAWEKASSLTDGAHASFQLMLDAERVDEERFSVLLEKVWLRDRFSLRRLREMEERGLVSEQDYQQALKPTAAEAERREEVFKRLIEQGVTSGAEGSPKQAPVIDPAEEHVSQTASTDKVDDLAAGEPEQTTAEGHGSQTASADESEELTAEAIEAATSEEHVSQTASADESEELTAEGIEVATADLDDSESVQPTANTVDEAAQRREAARQELLNEQARRIDSLSRPKPEPEPAPSSDRPAITVPGRGMQTRGLARIYLEQEYSRLALQVLATLLEDAPGDKELLAMRRRARKQIAEKKESLKESRSRRGRAEADE